MIAARAFKRIEETVAGAQGFEPRPKESKSRVLPLHHAPIYTRHIFLVA